jgi:hypothetical protein
MFSYFELFDFPMKLHNCSNNLGSKVVCSVEKSSKIVGTYERSKNQIELRKETGNKKNLRLTTDDKPERNRKILARPSTQR